MQGTKKENPKLFVRPSYDLRQLLKSAIKQSPDEVVRKQGRGWFPRLIKAALSVYVESLLNQKAESK